MGTITKNTEVMFADAKVTGADVLATNGVIHVINKVVLPPSGSATTTAKATTSGSAGSAITSDASLSALANLFTVSSTKKCCSKYSSYTHHVEWVKCPVVE